MDGDFRQAMTGVSPVLRRAALLLHSLPANDQEWVLQRLPQGGRASLADMLAELQALGIPADPEWVEGVLLSRSPPVALPAAEGATGTQASAAEALRGFDPVEVRALSMCLQVELRGVTERLLSLERWSWSDQFKELGAGPAMHEGPRRMPLDEEAGHCLRAALSEAVLKRVRAVACSLDDRESEQQAVVSRHAVAAPRSAWSTRARRLFKRLVRRGAYA